MSADGFLQYYLEGKKLVGFLFVNADWKKIEEEKEKIGKQADNL